MNTLYQGMFGSEHNPRVMMEIHDDTGLETSSIMTMYYVQYAAEVEAPELNLSLPKGFPNGWQCDDSGVLTNDIDEYQTSSSMLQLTVSKLQKDVSRSMTQIGFENVMEYVIDAPTDSEVGEEFPENPDEFLSIDIANVDKRLGVEVDGPGHFVRLIDAKESSCTHSNSNRDQFADRGENRVNGPTLLKHRLLTALGWNIIHIPYWEYQYLSDDTEKEEYCRSVMNNYSSSWSL